MAKKTKDRVTPEEMTQLPEGGIFVFGSNETGAHGAGAAALAFKGFGARMYLGFGPAGNTFAIPTKDWNIQTLPLEVIGFYIKRFIAFVNGVPKEEDVRFYVTKIGCGLAGYTPEDIAPFFAPLRTNERVYLPKEFINIIDKAQAELEKQLKSGRPVIGEEA